MVSAQLSKAIFQEQANLLKLLAHPARLAILRILENDGESCVCHLEAKLGYRQAYISQQLALLRNASIIEDQRDGWNVFYRIKDQSILIILDAVQQVTSAEVNIEALVSRPIPPCPCPRCNETG